MHEDILHNLLLLIEQGAFHRLPSEERPTPMSQHKWRKLVEAAKRMNVLRFVGEGALCIKDDDNVSPVLLQTLEEREYNKEKNVFDSTSAHLFNHWTQERLNDVREEEMNSHDTSDESLILLDIIIKNAEFIITNDTCVEGVIMMGQYIRDNKEKINYEKIRSWLAHIGLVQVASMEGNMLIDCMHFSAEELPFVIKPFPKAKHLFLNSVKKVFHKHSFSTVTRMNVAMLETISYRFMKAISMVTDIEE